MKTYSKYQIENKSNCINNHTDVNGPDTPIKSHRLLNWIKKQNLNMYCIWEYLRFNDKMGGK